MQDDPELLRDYDKLRQALNELVTIYNDAPVGLAVIGADFRFQRINSRLAEMNGVPVAGHIGRTIREVVPQLADIGESLVRKVVTTGAPILNLEIEGETAAEPGVQRSFVEHWSPIRGDDGTVVAVNIVVEETTKQKRAEKAVQASEAALRNVLNSIADAFLVLDRDFRITIANREAAHISGETSDALLQRSFWDVWPAAPGTRIETMLRGVMADKEPARLEHHYISDRQDIWLDISAYPTSDGIAVFYRDISERKFAEDQLIRNERRLATALRAGKLGVFEYTYRPKSAYYWDNTVRQIWGAPETGDITDAHFWSSLHPEDAPRIIAIGEEIAARGTPSRLDIEYRIYRISDHALRWVNISLDIVHDEHGPYRMIGTAQDITERKLAEEHAKLLMREINHRSKNLLAVVQSIAQQMTRTTDLNSFPERFSERLAGLASSQDLLVKSFWKGVPLDALISSQLSHYQHLIGSRIQLIGGHVSIAAGAAQNLGMALHELATNAAKYGALSNDAGEVEIAWQVLSDPAGNAEFHLTWQERNGPPVTPPAHHGLGSYIVSRLLKHSLGAEVNQNFAASGVRWAMRAPASGILDSIA